VWASSKARALHRIKDLTLGVDPLADEVGGVGAAEGRAGLAEAQRIGQAGEEAALADDLLGLDECRALELPPEAAHVEAAVRLVRPAQRRVAGAPGAQLRQGVGGGGQQGLDVDG
jgi:hypothetical protein